MKENFVIAIDGIAGAGKSTIATGVSKILKVNKLNTGDIYRAITLKYINSNAKIENDKDAKKFVKTLDIKINYDRRKMQHTFLDGVDVTKGLHAYEISKVVSTISHFKPLRDYVIKIQREIAAKGNIVVEGRDIGSHVLPNADYKIFLTASVKVRAKRQFEELVKAGDKKVTLKDLEKEITKRDYNDTHREYGALKVCEDSKVIDTSKMTIDEVIAEIVKYVKGN